MNIIVSGRHVKVTEAMKTYAQEKASKFSRIWSAINNIEITMDIEHGSHLVEAVVHIQGGANIVAQTQTEDMYAALDVIEDKVERQLRKLKGKTQDHHPRMRSTSSPEQAEREPTYNEIVHDELDPS